MDDNCRKVAPGPSPRTVTAEDGTVLEVPAEWELLPPGDGPLTRLVKSKGASWVVQQKKGRRLISKGVWCNGCHIRAAKEEIAQKRQAPGYAQRRHYEQQRREKIQRDYVEEFFQAVLRFLDFHHKHEDLALRVARAVTELATPVGSKTVARTATIPLEQRAQKAVVAWLRHQTTTYDSMKIARVKGERRRVRRELARSSQQLLAQYRSGEEITDPSLLPEALVNLENSTPEREPPPPAN
ncbi:DUF2293 domain-containing protein [Desulforhopalus singaporensis]|uniref:Uncharacterized conserved protein n=1 Tax=Desulforhopalus singaporensis TaxID=91360 RepID=A0A1H0RIQ2_9BACT|nr:DUF2293 domain-containing protein [Desulforhopalus singaporensis]SDP29417.1 Uncharacterized conserved protein [Desulforhopalus singaporensis]